MKKIIWLLITLMLLAGCSSEPEYTRYQNSTVESGFDTEMRLIAYTYSQKEFDEYFQKMKDEFLHYHRLFDRFNTYEGINNIRTINDNAGIKPVEVDPIIIDMLLKAKEYNKLSAYFDISYGAVYEVWHEYREAGIDLNEDGEYGELPSKELLEEKKALSGWEYVEIDESKNTVFLTKEGVLLDVGAIAKGYATEKVALTLESEGLEYAIVSGGGNIRTINHKPDGSSWDVGIQIPTFSPGQETIDVFSFDQSISVVTSGDYQRYYYIEGDELISHLVNPLTLYPETKYRSATIITKDSTLADALSTSIFMMDYEEGLEFVEKFNAQFPDDVLEIVWVKDNEEAWYTGNGYSYQITDGLIPLSKNLNKTDN